MCGALRALGGHRAQLTVSSCRAGMRWVTGAGAGAWENLEAVVPLVAQGAGFWACELVCSSDVHPAGVGVTSFCEAGWG